MSEVSVTDLGEGIARVALERPDIRNALAAELREALVTTLQRLDADDAVRAVVLTGSNGDFSAGGDIRSMGTLDHAAATARMAAVKTAALAIAGFGKPLVAAVEGNAAGAGIGLALLADAVVAADSAVFTFSFRNLALGPDWGLSHTLTERVSVAQARRWLLAGTRLRAIEAHSMGLVDDLVPVSRLTESARTLADQLARAPMASEPLKHQLRDRAALAAALDREAALQVERFLSEPHKAAVAAFLARKRRD
jgi:enoyl-CoA hydratase/carnithine racemase